MNPKQVSLTAAIIVGVLVLILIFQNIIQPGAGGFFLLFEISSAALIFWSVLLGMAFGGLIATFLHFLLNEKKSAEDELNVKF